jgi:alkylation response protein AidB-like acyl-CoA dehydrogenase
MSFEVASLCDAIDKMMQKHLPAAEVRRRDAAADPPDHLLEIFAEMGLFQLVLPEKEGGLGGSWQQLSIIQERLGYHATMAALLYNRVACFGMMTLLTSASPAQKKTWLPKLLAGEGAFALGLSEAGAGSDAGALQTRAEKSEAGWKITGRKIWISGAAAALQIVVAARTDLASTGGRGVTLFLVPPDAEGVSMTRLDKVGNRCSLSYDIGFDGVLVPDEARIGAVGGGFDCLKKTLFYARSGLASAVVGTAQAAVDTALAHARERRQFGQPIGRFQVLAHRLAQMQTEVDLARLITRELARAIDAGEECTRRAAQAKLVTTETLKKVTEQGMQIMASAGYAAESDMQRYWRDARLYSFGEGSSEILLDLIAADMGAGRGIKL